MVQLLTYLEVPNEVWITTSAPVYYAYASDGFKDLKSDQALYSTTEAVTIPFLFTDKRTWEPVNVAQASSYTDARSSSTSHYANPTGQNEVRKC